MKKGVLKILGSIPFMAFNTVAACSAASLTCSAMSVVRTGSASTFLKNVRDTVAVGKQVSLTSDLFNSGKLLPTILTASSPGKKV